MTAASYRLPALAVSAGLAALGLWVNWTLLPRVEEAAIVRATIGPGDAVRIARQAAAGHGHDVSGWSVLVRGWEEGRLRELQRSSPGQMPAALLFPLTYQVKFTAANGRWVRIDVFADGRPRFYEAGSPDARPAVPAPLDDAVRARLLDEFAGAQAAHFHEVSSTDAPGLGRVTIWEWREPSQPEMLAQLEVVSSAEGVKRADLRSTFSEEFVLAQNRRRSADLALRMALYPLLIAAGIALSSALFFRSLVHGRVRVRRLVVLFTAILMVLLAGYFLAGGYAGARFFSDALEPVTRSLAYCIGIAVTLSGMWAAGRSFIRGAELARWRTMDALLSGNLWRREVGLSLACGLLVGAALPAVPRLMAWFGVGANATSMNEGDAAIWAQVPALWPCNSIPAAEIAFPFFLLLPLSGAWRFASLPRWLRVSLLLGFGGLVIAVARAPLTAQWPPANLLFGVLIMGASLVLYRFVDLLAVTASGAAWYATLTATALLFHQSAELDRAAWLTVALYGAPVLLGIAAAVIAPALEVDPEEDIRHDTVADRDRLLAEFELARKAQRRFLPDLPDSIDGRYSLAASCHPAREVGGDLYDFFRYPDGTYGLCVADVSGKGVPAALYMTMTKGILAAARRDTADLKATAAALNQHLHLAGRRRTFVTMALGRLDAAAGTLEFARAGHNEILVRRAATGRAGYLKPKGVGLGLTSNFLFERSLAVESLSLAPGDLVVFYSDGIPEAMNPARELFGEARLRDVVERYAGEGAPGLEREILREVREFMAGEPPHDDMTLLILRA